MRQIWLGANAVFRESVRDRVPYTIVVFAVLMIGASYLISQLTAGQDMKIIKDLGLAALSMFGLLIAIFIGVGLVTKEVEKRSVYGLLTKPLSRAQFLLGKYAGLVMTLAVNLSVMTAALYAVLLYSTYNAPAGLRASWEAPGADPLMLIAIALIFAELMLVTALALLFSTFSSPLWATLLTLGLWVAGHFNSDLRNFGAVVDSAPAIWLARAIYYVIPNLAPFDVKAEVVHGIHVGASHVMYTLAYAALHISILLTASITIFGRRDFASPSTPSATHASTSLRASDGRPAVGPAFAAIAVLLAAAIAVQVVRDRGWAPYEPESSVLWVRSGETAKRLALSFDTVVSDVYWIRAVIYYGGRRADTRRSYDQLFPLLDLVTSLDPQFKVAYRFGALFLSEPPPGGPGRPDQAIALLERGVERDGDWEYYEDIGFVYYWWKHDYVSAAEWFKKAASRPGAPNWLIGLAATTLAVGGSRESSRQLWAELLSNPDASYIQDQARHRLQQLDAMDAIDQLAVSLQRFKDRAGRLPGTWQELVASEPLPGIPVDPAGVPFVVDAVTGKIDVSRQSPLWPLPTEPAVGPR